MWTRAGNVGVISKGVKCCPGPGVPENPPEKERIVRISIILAHPNHNSFNHALAKTVEDALRGRGDEVTVHDLYVEGFEAVMPVDELKKEEELPLLVDRHCKEIVQADGLIIVHPNWWGMPPAILKGWVDRVIRPGVAYVFQDNDKGEGVPVGLLKAHAGLILNTSDTPPEREQAVFGDPLETIWRNCILGFCGVKNVRRETFSVVVTSTFEERQVWLKMAVSAAMETFPY